MITFPFTLFSSIEFVNEYSFQASGVDEYATINDNVELSITSNLSLSVWFKSSSLSDQSLISKWTSAGSERAYSLALSSTGAIRILISSNGTNGSAASKDWTTTSTGFLDGTWHHVVGTFDSAGNLKLYVDSVEIVAFTKTFDHTMTAIYDSTSQVNIGAFDSGGSWFFDGNMDEISVYDTVVLSQADVNRLYNSGKPINLSQDIASVNLVAWWRCGDNDVGTALSDNASSNDLSMINSDVTNNCVLDVP